MNLLENHARTRRPSWLRFAACGPAKDERAPLDRRVRESHFIRFSAVGNGGYAFGRQHWSPFSPEPVEFAPLNFDFHPATVRTWLQLSGFVVERTLTVSHYRIGLFKKLRTEVKRYLKKLDELPHHVNLREEDVALIQAVA